VGEGEHMAVWNWQKVRPYQPTAENVRRTKYEGGRVRVLRRSALSATVETRAGFEHCTIVQTFTFVRDHDWIDLTIDVLGWDGTHARELRVLFPFSRENAHIVYEGPFQHINAGSDEVQPFESMRPREVQNFIQASADGISLTLSGSTVAYDWVDPLDSERRSLLQSVLIATKRSCHSRGNWYEQEGSHRFQFRISASSLTPVARHRFGWGATAPLRVVQGRGAIGGSADGAAGGARERGNPSKAAPSARKATAGGTGAPSFLAVDCDHVMITALKAGAEPGSTVVRLWEFSGEDVLVRLSLPAGIVAAERGGLIETSGESRERLRIASGAAEVAIKRNEIVTIHLYTNVPSRR
jgi:alpha-mannosidase